jgi:hypothetical protein
MPTGLTVSGASITTSALEALGQQQPFSFGSNCP